MMKLVLVFAFMVAFGDAYGYSNRNGVTIEDKGTHLLICRQKPIELGIILDGSSSINLRGNNFKIAKKFLQDFLQQFDIGNGRNSMRVSIIPYGSVIHPQDGFDLTTFDTKEKVIEAIGRIPYKGRDTNTGAAIDYMHHYQFARSVVRPYAMKVAIVLTDGNSQETTKTKLAAEAARADNITIFAIGIGNGIDDNELTNIAGDSSRVRRVGYYTELDSIKKYLATKTCYPMQKPTTTPPPRTETCGEANPADIYFVFSPASLGLDFTAWATSFMSETMASEGMEDGFQYGVISGSCPEDEGFDLDRYNNVNDINQHLAIYDRAREPKLLRRLARRGFVAKSGARSGARKVAVLVVSGDKKSGSLGRQVARLVQAGVQVFIADPSGNQFQIGGATTLFGTSSTMVAQSLIQNLCPK